MALINSSLKDSASYIIGTPQSLNSYYTLGNDNSTTINCYSSAEINDDFLNISEISTGVNPFTGFQHSFFDPFSNTTFFVKDNLYSDLLRYSLTSNAINYFNQTFFNHNLQGDQYAVACTAFCLKELGYNFFIIIRSEDFTLVKFCKNLEWHYKIVS